MKASFIYVLLLEFVFWLKCKQNVHVEGHTIYKSSFFFHTVAIN